MFSRNNYTIRIQGSLSYSNLYTRVGKKRKKKLDTDFKYSVGEKSY